MFRGLKVFVLKAIASIICIALASLPFDFFLFVKHVLQPNGFWQKLVVYGAGMYFLGVIQLVLAIILLVFLFAIWFGDLGEALEGPPLPKKKKFVGTGGRFG